MAADTLNGEFIYVLLISIFDAAILSWMALRWYRRSIAVIMATPVRAEPVLTEPASTAGLPASSAARARAIEPSRIRRRIVIAYVAGSLAFAAVTGGAFVVASGNPVPPAFAALIWAHAWPVWPALTILLAYDRRQSLKVLAIYLAAGAAGVAIATSVPRLLRGSVDLQFLSNIYFAVLSLVITASVSLVLVAITGIRRVRAVMPLALSGTIVFGIGLMLFRRLIVGGFNNPSFRGVMLDLAGWSSTEVAYYGLYFVMAVPLGWCAWQALGQLARAYTGKRFSDIQLMVDCWFAIAATGTMAMDLIAPFGVWGIGIGVAAFAAYRGTVAIVLRMLPLARSGPEESEGLRLLLLRVFGFQQRTEALFDQLSRRWRFEGPVQLIGGTDLAMRTVDPGEVLSFIEGHLRDQYVSSVVEIGRRIERLDLVRDPDGRFRVNDIFCLNNTWQQTFQAMLSVTDLVVMDLRGFSEKNAGCQFELEQLVRHVPADRIVLVTDRTTDEPLLKQMVAAPVSIVVVDDEVRVGIRRIIACLIDAAYGPRRVAPAPAS